MKLRLSFGLNEHRLEMSWWKTLADFPTLVTYKGKKWEFVMYNRDPSGQFEWDCIFSQVQQYDPNFHATVYVALESLMGDTYGNRCTCGAAYTSFPWDHMRMCDKWSKW